MNPLILLTLFFTFIRETPVLAQDTAYFNSNWQETTVDKASYFRIKTKWNAGWKVTDYLMTGKPQMTGQYSDDSCHIQEEEFAWYDSSGLVIHRCNYAHDKEDGPETYYYSNGQIRITGANKDDDLVGEWIGYYPSGKISGKAKYKKGKQVSGTFYHEDGTRDKAVTEFWRDSEFTGGIPQWTRFLNKTFRYPDSAVNYEIQGTVVVAFTISREGKAFDFRVVQSVDKCLDEEALRVMRLAPDWTPAIMGGILSESYKKQPIIFKLQSE